MGRRRLLEKENPRLAAGLSCLLIHSKVLFSTFLMNVDIIHILDYIVLDFFLRFTYFMCLSALLACMCTTCMPGTQGGQKIISYVLELEIQMVVNCHWVLELNSGCLQE